ncbi:hypothetical protein HYS54_03525 [Candidatus Micrarchaeota archaeon]|nr:hypothetical protein [Candidatus Micrarchaeota archaeon]
MTHISDDDISKMDLNEVEHFKIHVIPRFRNDRVSLSWGRGPEPGIAARAKTASEIKRFLK